MQKTWKELGFKDKISYVLCVCSFVFGITLTCIGIFIPPPGEIHGSVLTVIGMFLTFCGSILGISQHYKVELEKIKAEITDKENMENTE